MRHGSESDLARSKIAGFDGGAGRRHIVRENAGFLHARRIAAIDIALERRRHRFRVARRTIIRDLQELIRRGDLEPEVYPKWESGDDDAEAGDA